MGSSDVGAGSSVGGWGQGPGGTGKMSLQEQQRGEAGRTGARSTPMGLRRGPERDGKGVLRGQGEARLREEKGAEGKYEVWGRGRGWEQEGGTGRQTGQVREAGWGKGDDDGGETAGEEVRTEAGAGTRWRRGDGESAQPCGCPLPLSRRTALGGAAREGLPCTNLGAPAPDLVARSGSSFPPRPGDFSAPETLSLRQVPLAASSPRGTPRPRLS